MSYLRVNRGHPARPSWPTGTMVTPVGVDGRVGRFNCRADWSNELPMPLCPYEAQYDVVGRWLAHMVHGI